VLAFAGLVDTGRINRLSREKVTTLGRASECTIRMRDVTISANHAEIVPIRGEYFVNDHGSTNGTYLNDVRIAGPALVRNGDCIRLGPHVILRFSLMSEDESHAVSRLYEMAVYDQLTDVHNRNYIDGRLQSEVELARVNRSTLSIVLLDLDRFKDINDTFGHPAGDAVLRAVARAMRGAVRCEDLLGRYGGEEFVVMTRAPAEDFGAVFIAERLQRTIAALQIRLPSGARGAALPPVSLTASFGVASLHECESPTREALIARADARLYRAKAEGRNRVVSTG
jgi:diguanylate cyclase (GGDEF)-like protein